MFRRIAAVVGVLFVLLVRGQVNFPVAWSSTYYGPDGPWQAVIAYAGGNDTGISIISQSNRVDLYPGGAYSTWLLEQAVCNGILDPTCGAGGFWEDVPSTTEISYQGTLQDPSTGLISAPSTIYVSQALSLENIDSDIIPAWNTSIAALTNASIPNPSGGTYGLEVGFLALGAFSVQSQTFSIGDTSTSLSGWMYPGYLYNTSKIHSYSYGLHIGSAAHMYSGSLVFGGYDKGRVIGPYTSYANPAHATLLDIGIGVETGLSPFDEDTYSGLLTTDTGSASIAIEPSPQSPYLSLPGSTCDSIARLLPVYQSPLTGYYMWNETNEKYSKIINSPAYLSFTFPPASGNTDNVVIKVPFALLNLTLSPPLVSTASHYFPCRAYQPSSNDPYLLGRAFLQAAFVGVNWLTEITWIAQAPGPGATGHGLGVEYTDIYADDSTINVYSDPTLFNSSWAGYWTPLTLADSTGSSLSTNQEVAIGAGIGGGVVFLAALSCAIVFLKKRKRSKVARERTGSDPDPFTGPYEKESTLSSNHASPKSPQDQQQYNEFPGKQENTLSQNNNTVAAGGQDQLRYQTYSGSYHEVAGDNSYHPLRRVELD